MFDIWFNGEDRIELETQCCLTCGFVCFSPRPDSDDVRKKYEFLAQHESLGILHNRSRRALRLDMLRSRRLLAAVKACRSVSNARVLDVGGGDGRLLRSFFKYTSNCFLVDINEHPIEGVTRLGSDIEQLDGTLFDVIVCSHVIEHVADPRAMLSRLRTLLAPGGLIYVEVPFELWLDAPIKSDPVTHINFFTRHSFLTVLQMAELAVKHAQYDIAPYGAMFKRVIWAVATRPECSRKPVMDAQESIGLIAPTRRRRLCRNLESAWIRGVLNLELTIASAWKRVARR